MLIQHRHAVFFTSNCRGRPPDGGERERDLLSSLRDGDREAAAELYRRHVRSALGIAVQELRDIHLAHDVVSEAFTRVLAAVSTGRGPTVDFGAYLRTSVRHLAWADQDARRRLGFVDDVERCLRGRVRTGRDRAEDCVPSGTEAEEALAVAFAQLNTRHRRILRLRILCECTSAQSAAALRITPSAEAQLYRRARLALKARLLAALKV